MPPGLGVVPTVVNSLLETTVTTHFGGGQYKPFFTAAPNGVYTGDPNNNIEKVTALETANNNRVPLADTVNTRLAANAAVLGLLRTENMCATNSVYKSCHIVPPISYSRPSSVLDGCDWEDND